MVEKVFMYSRDYAPCFFDPTDYCLARESTLGVWITYKNRKSALAGIKRKIQKIIEQSPYSSEARIRKIKNGRKIEKIILELEEAWTDETGEKHPHKLTEIIFEFKN